MRRFISITMMVLFLLTFITGLAEAHVHPGESGIHTPLAILFVVVTVVHVALNWKAMGRYLGGKKVTSN